GLSVDLLPPLRNLGEDVVVAPADEIGVAQTVVLPPPSARGEIPHLAIEDGDRRGRVLDEEPERPLPLANRFLSLAGLLRRLLQPRGQGRNPHGARREDPQLDEQSAVRSIRGVQQEARGSDRAEKSRHDARPDPPEARRQEDGAQKQREDRLAHVRLEAERQRDRQRREQRRPGVSLNPAATDHPRSSWFRRTELPPEIPPRSEEHT